MLGGPRSVAAGALVLSLAATAGGETARPPLLDGFRIDGTTRLYSFDRSFDHATRDQRDIALGGRLAFRTGRVAGIQGGVTIHTAQDLDPESDRRAVYGLLAADRAGRHADYTAVGEAFLDGAWGGTSVRAGRTELNTPWLNGHDIRMTPHAFEAIQLAQVIGPWRITAGAAQAIKTRTSELFLEPPEVLRLRERGAIWFGGIVLDEGPRTRVQLWHYTATDIWQDWYIAADAATRPVHDLSWFGNIRLLRRLEDGRALAGPQGTWMAGATGGAQWRGWTVSVTGSRIGERLVQRPWGHDLAISEQVEPCNDPREKAWLVRAGFDFGRLGLAGLTASVGYSEYAAPLGATGRQAQSEIDYDLRYAFASGWEARVRFARVHAERNGQPSEGNRDLRFQLVHKFALAAP